MSLAHRLVAGSVLAGLLALAPAAAADPPGADVLLARQLANEGIALSQKGDHEGAIAKLQRAEAIHHAPTILVHIGDVSAPPRSSRRRTLVARPRGA